GGAWSPAALGLVAAGSCGLRAGSADQGAGGPGSTAAAAGRPCLADLPMLPGKLASLGGLYQRPADAGFAVVCGDLLPTAGIRQRFLLETQCGALRQRV